MAASFELYQQRGNGRQVVFKGALRDMVDLVRAKNWETRLDGRSPFGVCYVDRHTRVAYQIGFVLEGM